MHTENEEHVLVCLSSSPSNANVIKTAANMAQAYHAAFTALYVNTPYPLSQADRKRLQENIKLAKDLGAQIETIFGDDIPYQICEYARLSHITKIVVGRSRMSQNRFFIKPSLVDRLIAQAGDEQVFIIPNTPVKYAYPKIYSKKFRFTVEDSVKCVIILLLTTCTCLIFYELGYANSSLIAFYILAIVLISIFTKHPLYSVFSSILSVLIFNYLFAVPRFILRAYASDYPVTILIMVLASMITGSLAIRLKDFGENSSRVAFRTKVLFETNQLLQKANSNEEILTVMADQIQKLVSKDVLVYEEGKAEPYIFFNQKESTIDPLKDDMAVLSYVKKYNKQAGLTTANFPESSCLYTPISVNQQCYGVVGIPLEEMDPFENSILLSIVGESALAIENYRNAKEKEEAAIAAENERLRANMLRSISHDLRTPLTSISGNASNLLSSGNVFDEAMKKQIYEDIYEDSMWLISLVENLLSVTRIENGNMNLNLSYELMEELVEEALEHVNPKKIEHEIHVHSTEDYLLAYVDASLIVQVLINLVDDAIKYTPKGSHIDILLSKCENMVVCKGQDDGYGIANKEHIFDMFYTDLNSIVDSRRSLGLGLSLCHSIVLAHGGTITVEDNIPHGTIFTFTLPFKEVKINE